MPPPRGWTAGEVVVRVVQWLAPTIPFAAAWTGAVPVLRLRSPRPRLRRALRQPGMVACLAAVAGSLWAATGLGEAAGAARLTGSALLNGWLFFFVVEEVFPDIGLAVLAAWLGLALAGRWRPVPDWPDRLGRFLGCYWIGLGLFWYGRRYLNYIVS